MEKMKNETEATQADFFAEALRAFDAPAAAQEAPQPVAVPEVEKKKKAGPLLLFLRKWWLALLCCVACAALALSFWRTPERTPYRGEHWLYGSVMSYGDSYMVLQDMHGENWYVDIAGLEVPQWQADTYFTMESRWVFYDGEPKDCDQKDCTKKVTATMVMTAGGDLVEGLEQYELIYDEAVCDLDGDGENERWLLCNGPTSGVASMRLVALDTRGNAVRDAVLFLNSHGNFLLQSDGDQLQIIGVSMEKYVTMDVSIKDGRMSVSYSDGAPVTTEEYGATIGPAPGKTCIRYTLLTAVSGKPETGWMELPDETASSFKSVLDKLPWEENPDASATDYDGVFELSIDGELSSYMFAHDGTLYCDGKMAQMKEGLFLQMIRLMGQDSLAGVVYVGLLETGEQVSLSLTEKGTFELFIRESNISYLSTQGSYGVIGEYVYLSNGYEGGKRQPLVYVFRMVENTLIYCADLSAVASVWALPDGFRMLDNNALGGVIQFHVYDTPSVPRDDPPGVTTNSISLEPTEARRLRRILDTTKWWTDLRVHDKVVTGSFVLNATYGDDGIALWQPQTYYFTTNGYLVHGDQWGSIYAEDQVFLLELLGRGTEPVYPVIGNYLGYDEQGDEVRLYLDDGGTFVCTYRVHEFSKPSKITRTRGEYFILDDKVFLYCTTMGDWNMQFAIGEGQIVYMGGSYLSGSYGIPKDMVFDKQ